MVTNSQFFFTSRQRFQMFAADTAFSFLGSNKLGQLSCTFLSGVTKDEKEHMAILTVRNLVLFSNRFGYRRDWVLSDGPKTMVFDLIF